MHVHCYPLVNACLCLCFGGKKKNCAFCRLLSHAPQLALKSPQSQIKVRLAPGPLTYWQPTNSRLNPFKHLIGHCRAQIPLSAFFLANPVPTVGSWFWSQRWVVTASPVFCRTITPTLTDVWLKHYPALILKHRNSVYREQSKEDSSDILWLTAPVPPMRRRHRYMHSVLCHRWITIKCVTP